MNEFFTRFAENASQFTGRPYTFIAAFALVIGWAVTGPFAGFGDTWQLIINTTTTIITFLMVFLIQNSQNRDTVALEIKLDILLLHLGEHQYVGIEHKSDKELEKARKAIEERKNK